MKTPGAGEVEAIRVEATPAPPGAASARQRRVALDPDQAEKGLAELVLAVLELVRQLVERQALRRIEAAGLSPEEIERLGLALMRLEQQMEELKRRFGIESLDIELGPLGRLVDR